MFNYFRFLIMMLVLFPVISQACSYNYIGSPYTVNYGNITVQRDLPVGSSISNFITGTNAKAYSCVTSGTEGSLTGIKSGVLSYWGTGANGSRIYKTNLAGVGISFGTNASSTAGAASWNGSAWIGQSQPRVISLDSWVNAWSSKAGETDTYYYQPIIQLWKIGDITSGSLTGQLASYIANTNGQGTGSWVQEIPIYAGSGTITELSCSITTPNLNFPIGNVLTSSFGSAIGNIPSGAQSTQNMGLNCNAGANINVMLQGTQNPDVSTTSVLALTGQGNADVAKGVGVQLLYNGAPLVLNNRIVLKQSAGGQESFPITARYYQTRTSVATGKANASATLDLTYQ